MTVMEIEMIKCHGSGNDFIIIDEMDDSYHLTETSRIALTKVLADRKGPAGSDGLLFIQTSSEADARMRMFNSDGSEAEMCGNGLRCVARYILERFGKKEAVIETMQANLAVAETEAIFPDVPTFEVAIEPVLLDPASLPLTTDYTPHIEKPIPELDIKRTYTALSVPNPHLVSITDALSPEEVEKVGQQANENKRLLPNGTNVSFLSPIESQKIFVRTFERGVGLTSACGTAMSASALVSILAGHNNLNEVITVLNPGGMVQCVVRQTGDDGYTIRLRGNATYEFSAVVSIDPEDMTFAELNEMSVYEDEIAGYEKLAQAAAELSAQ
ncbi:diaminopimelate epimerase [Salisediminibacterium halotolerans]|nr:diaminopimelate epimerase [Actinophytocola xinjiangensis]RPE88457.1 diaminopimelate epimerase [Salisediminibacterium halotolerans]TWG37181.1 diaminopimelate epimerase [Salisediminibacterium halotolerans]